MRAFRADINTLSVNLATCCLILRTGSVIIDTFHAITDTYFHPFIDGADLFGQW